MDAGFLTNTWCAAFIQNYSTILTAIPTILFGVLQAIAIFHPDVKTNGVFSLVEMWLTKKEEPVKTV